MPSRRHVRLLLILLGTLVLASCEHVDRPNRPLPDIKAARLDGGGRIDPDALRGKPWLINLWVPG